MNRDDVIRMAQEAGIVVIGEAAFKLCQLVAQHEREACANIAENWNSNGFPRTGVAAQIRARGQA
jgi:hypothetical protein